MKKKLTKAIIFSLIQFIALMIAVIVLVVGRNNILAELQRVKVNLNAGSNLLLISAIIIIALIITIVFYILQIITIVKLHPKKLKEKYQKYGKTILIIGAIPIISTIDWIIMIFMQEKLNKGESHE